MVFFAHFRRQGAASTASRRLRHHPDAIDATRPAGSSSSFCIAELVFHYGTISNLRAKGVDVGEIYETPKPAWWRQAYEYVGSFFRRAPAPKRKREDDDGGPPPKKKVVALLRQADENLSKPVEDDDDDVVDLTG